MTKLLLKLSFKNLAVLLAFVTVLSLVPLASQVPAEAAEIRYAWKEGMLWERVYSINDLKEGPILLMWKDNNVTYTSLAIDFISGISFRDGWESVVFRGYTPDQLRSAGIANISGEPDSFITYEDDPDIIRIKELYDLSFHLPNALITHDQGYCQPNHEMYLDDENEWVPRWRVIDKNADRGTISLDHRWYIQPYDYNGGRSYVGPGYVTLAYRGQTKSTTTSFLCHASGSLTRRINDDTDFILYIGREYTLHAITEDTVIASGTVVHMVENTLLDAGVKLTVEPGATLIIDGHFDNSGRILNYGTIIAKPEALVSTGNTASGGGTIENYGGKSTCSVSKKGADGKVHTEKMTGEGLFVAETGARIYLPGGSETFSLLAGAEATVGGRLVSPNGLIMSDASVRILNTGRLYCGYLCEQIRGKDKEYAVNESPETIGYQVKTAQKNTFACKNYLITEKGGLYFSKATDVKSAGTVTYMDGNTTPLV